MIDFLQTLGICVGALALAVIAYSVFLVAHTIVMIGAEEREVQEDLEEAIELHFGSPPPPPPKARRKRPPKA